MEPRNRPSGGRYGKQGGFQAGDELRDKVRSGVPRLKCQGLSVRPFARVSIPSPPAKGNAVCFDLNDLKSEVPRGREEEVCKRSRCLLGRVEEMINVPELKIECPLLPLNFLEFNVS